MKTQWNPAYRQTGQMTLVIQDKKDSIIRVHHNYLRHQRSIILNEKPCLLQFHTPLSPSLCFAWGGGVKNNGIA